jgi:hypothetical protein
MGGAAEPSLAIDFAAVAASVSAQGINPGDPAKGAVWSR